MRRPARSVLALLPALLCLGAVAATPSQAAFPGPNGMLTFAHDLPGLDGGFEAERINADGSGEGLLLPPLEGVRFTLSPDWSPSGNQVVYERRREWGGAIYTANADGSGERRRSPAGVASHNAVWSPDGTRIAYRRYDLGNAADASLWVMNADGSGQTQIIPVTLDPGGCSAYLAGMDWGVSDRIAFIGACEASAGGGWYLWTVKPDGGDLQKFTAGDPAMLTELGYHATNLDWSPDGKKIAYGSYLALYPAYYEGRECSNGLFPYDIYVADLEHGTNTNLTATTAWEGPHEVDPAWSPDGTQIAFAALSTTCVGGNIVFTHQPLFRMPSGGGARTQVTDPQPRVFANTEGNPTSLETSDYTPDWQPCIPGTTRSCVSVAPPRNTSPPVISGTAAAGSTLTCGPGSWTGASTYAYAWLRGGVPVAGATAATHVVVTDDASTELTCTVTASGPGGSASATSAGVQVGAGAASGGAPGGTPGGAPGAGTTRATSVILLPSRRSCVSRRAFPIRLHAPRGERLERATVRLPGRRARVVTRRLSAPITLTGLPKGRWTVGVEVKTNRHTYRLKRTYRTCAPRRR